jgi:hypothetical protein
LATAGIDVLSMLHNSLAQIMLHRNNTFCTCKNAAVASISRWRESYFLIR